MAVCGVNCKKMQRISEISLNMILDILYMSPIILPLHLFCKKNMCLINKGTSFFK